MPQGAAKLIIEVTAGINLGDAMPEYTKRWVVTVEQYLTMTDPAENQKTLRERSAEWHSARSHWLQVHGVSREYQASLENPGLINWVNRAWIWV